MEHCPTCNARYKEKPACYRCGTDLARLVAIEKEAAGHHAKATEAFHQQNFQTMYFHAHRACSLLRTPASEKLLACAALSTGDHKTALSSWKRLQITQKSS